MHTNPSELLAAFPVGRRKADKAAFREAVQEYASFHGYATQVEGDRLLIGDEKEASYLLCAVDADSAVLTILEILRILPENRRSRAAFVLFDRSLPGAYSYVRMHPEAAKQLVVYLGEISGGDRIRFFPTKRLREERVRLTSLYKACGYFGKKNLLVQEQKVYPRFLPFPAAAYVCALENGKKEVWGSRVKKAATVDTTNINILRAALVSYICCDAAQ